MVRYRKSAMTLLLMLGLVASVLGAWAPAGAAAGRAGGFELDVTFMDETGSTANVSDADAQINITVNVSIAAGMENVTDLRLLLDIDSGGVQAEEPLGALNEGEFAEHTFEWMPVVYGDHQIVVTAINGTDADNQTVSTRYFKALASDITVRSVEATASSALIGVDEVTLTAALANAGNAPGTAAVTFSVDGNPIATVDQDVPEGGNADAILITDFSGLNLSDGEHVLGASMTDWIYSEATAAENITLSNPAAVLALEGLTASEALALEGTNVTLTARVNNSGTANAAGLTVEFSDGTGALGTVDNVSVDMGQVKDVVLVWTLPDVAADTTVTVTAKLGDLSASVNVTVVARIASIQITDFAVPDGLKIGDEVNFTVTVKNNGTGDATGVVVELFDGATRLAGSAPFNLSVGSSKVVSLSVTLSGTPDVDHTFLAKAEGAERNLTRKVAHTPVPASVGISSFSVKPTKRENQPQDSTQSYTLTVVLQNLGELKSTNCTLTVKEGGKVIATETIALDGNGTVTKTYTWRVKGSGGHTATATLSGAEAGTPSTMTTKCTLEYTPGFEVVLLVCAIVVAALMFRRRTK